MNIFIPITEVFIAESFVKRHITWSNIHFMLSILTFYFISLFDIFQVSPSGKPSQNVWPLPQEISASLCVTITLCHSAFKMEGMKLDPNKSIQSLPKYHIPVTKEYFTILWHLKITWERQVKVLTMLLSIK